MKASNEFQSPNKNNNFYRLSKEAINYLDNQIIKDGESRTIEAQFTFQVIYAIKKLKNWYCCSLMDRNSKYGGFCIKYNKRYGEPKEGDIIKTKHIQIVKLPNRDTNLYFCDNVKKIEESKKMILNPQVVESITKIRSTSKKKAYLKYNIFQNYNEEDDQIDNININSPIQNRIINLGQNSFSENKKINLSSKKPTLISELTSFTNNPYFILKCLAKSEIVPIASKYNITGIDFVQNYLFSDINGDKIQAVSFSFDLTEKIDKLLEINSVYKIFKAAKKMNFKKEFSIANGDIQLLFSHYTRIEELSEEEKKNQQFKDKTEFTKIIDILNCENKIFNVYGIVLEDKGIIEKKKANNEIIKFRRIIIGDDTLHKVNLILWEDTMVESKELFWKGDIISATNFKYRPYYIYYQLNSIFTSKLNFLNDPKQEKNLKNFYNKHIKIEEYNDLTFVELDNRKDIQGKFIQEFLDEYETEMKKQNNFNSQFIKINGTVINIEHGDNNVYSGCKICYKKFDDFCPTCNIYNTKLYFDFHIKIADCTNCMWLHLIGETAENFIGITPEEYQILIKYNNKYKLDEIDKKILNHQYTFIGKYMLPNSDNFKSGGFSVFNHKKVDKDYFRKLIDQYKEKKEK